LTRSQPKVTKKHDNSLHYNFPSVRTHVTTREPQRHLQMWTFTKIYQNFPILVKIGRQKHMLTRFH